MQAVFSSAVPVLPATATPGIAAAVPVPSRTTPIISRRTVRATDGARWRAPRRRGGAAGKNVGARPAPAVGDRRRHERHLQRRRQHLALADRRRADGQFSLDLAGAAGSVLSARAGEARSWLKPNASAVATSRAAPSFDAERA